MLFKSKPPPSLLTLSRPRSSAHLVVFPLFPSEAIPAQHRNRWIEALPVLTHSKSMLPLPNNCILENVLDGSIVIGRDKKHL